MMSSATGAIRAKYAFNEFHILVYLLEYSIILLMKDQLHE
jgi:hypothetical protein